MQARALAVLRILIGVFLLAEGASKVGWLADSGPLSGRLSGWLEEATPAARWYLQALAIPGAPVLARLVMLGETAAGIALVLGVWTRAAAALSLLMVLNFHFASSAIFQWSFLRNGYGLPVVGALLALALGGRSLPWSLRR